MIRVEESDSRGFIRRDRAAERVLGRRLNEGLGLFSNPPRLSKVWNSVKKLGSLVVAKFRRDNPSKGIDVALDLQQWHQESDQGQSKTSFDIPRRNRIQPPDFKALRRSLVEANSYVDFQTKRVYQKAAQSSIRDIESLQVECDEEFMWPTTKYAGLQASVNKLPPPQILGDENKAGRQQKTVEFGAQGKKYIDNHDIRSTKSQDFNSKDIGVGGVYDQFGELGSQLRQESSIGAQRDDLDDQVDQYSKINGQREDQGLNSESVYLSHQYDESLPNNLPPKAEEPSRRQSKPQPEDAVSVKLQDNMLLVNPRRPNNLLQNPCTGFFSLKHETDLVNGLKINVEHTHKTSTDKALVIQNPQMSAAQSQKTLLLANPTATVSIPEVIDPANLKQTPKQKQSSSNSFLNAFLNQPEKTVDFRKLISDKTSTNTAPLFYTQQASQAIPRQQAEAISKQNGFPFTGNPTMDMIVPPITIGQGLISNQTGMDMEMQQPQVFSQDTYSTQQPVGLKLQMQPGGCGQGFALAQPSQPQTSLFLDKQNQMKATSMFARSPEKVISTLFHNQQQLASSTKSAGQTPIPKTNKKKRAYD